MNRTRTALVAGLALLLCLSAATPFALAWGNEGHRMVNKLAMLNLPADVPAFLRTREAIDLVEYLGPEPDRWRSLGEPELNAVQAPEHYIELEEADALGPIPHRRLDFEKSAYAHGKDPAQIGFQPWQATEVWERLKAALREYRHASAEHRNTRQVEQAILFYVGWLGHYVGDAAQPMHTTVNDNGWVGPNPHGYTTGHRIHWQFEGPFVGANIRQEDVQPLIAPQHALPGDIFDVYMAYLRDSATHVDEAYELEKNGGYEGKGTAASRAFAARRIAVGAGMLRDMIVKAWVDSALPVADRYAK